MGGSPGHSTRPHVSSLSPRFVGTNDVTTVRSIESRKLSWSLTTQHTTLCVSLLNLYVFYSLPLFAFIIIICILYDNCMARAVVNKYTYMKSLKQTVLCIACQNVNTIVTYFSWFVCLICLGRN